MDGVNPIETYVVLANSPGRALSGRKLPVMQPFGSTWPFSIRFHHISGQWFSKCGPWTSNISISWELV